MGVFGAGDENRVGGGDPVAQACDRSGLVLFEVRIEQWQIAEAAMEIHAQVEWEESAAIVSMAVFSDAMRKLPDNAKTLRGLIK